MDQLRQIVQSGHPSTWDSAWQANVTPWDAGTSQPPLQEVVESGVIHFPRHGHALVPGCGMGYDTIYLASALDLKVLGIDISETAIERARAYVATANIPGPGEVSFQVGDFFSFEPQVKFDVVYDYTFFVAIPPQRRVEWGQQMVSLVNPGGYLITLVWPIEPPSDVGPPFFVRVEHYKEVLGEAFEKVFDEIPETSLPKHVGKERIVVWKRV